MPAKRIHVSGRVQGVFFRAYTKEMADSLNVGGWVQNEPDGSVLIHAEGQDAALARLIAWCHDGPSGASVMSVSVEDVPEEKHTSFDVRH